MKLRDWRAQKHLTLKQLADLLGIGQGKNPSRRMQRIEMGGAPVDALLADKIVSTTDAEVTLQDLNDTRRDFLAAADAGAAA